MIASPIAAAERTESHVIAPISAIAAASRSGVMKVSVSGASHHTASSIRITRTKSEGLSI